MTESLLEMGLSNAGFSLILALVAVVVGIVAKRPQLTHLLWLLVFVKLVTPPIVTIPMDTASAAPETVLAGGIAPAESAIGAVGVETSASELSLMTHGSPWWLSIWALGSATALVWSLVRVRRFGRLLASESETAPPQVQAVAEELARRLELRVMPQICTTSARLSPMVWWAGGKVRVVLPATLLERLEVREWRWVLAHELAHVRRRDYLVRWLEWSACAVFWWNPVVWWAQRNLRASEEVCCDALVLSSLRPGRRTYADSILKAVESLAAPVLRPPAVASEINSGGFLERRFQMIVSNATNRSLSRPLQACVLLAALFVLPLGVARAQDYEAVGKRLREAVQAGELTPAQARIMLQALRKASAGEGEKKADRLEAIERKLRDAVAAGKLTKEQAKAKWAAIEKKIAAKKAAGAKKRGGEPGAIRERLRALKERLGAAVEAGELTEDEAKAKFAEAMERAKGAAAAKKPDGDRGALRMRLAALKERLGAAVKAGKMTEAEAKAKFDEAVKRVRAAAADKKPAGDRGALRMRLAALKERLGAAVKAGEMTEEQAKAKFEEAVKRVRAIATEKKPDVDRSALRQRLGALKERLGAAVKAGEMTEEEAKAKFDEAVKRVKQAAAGRKAAAAKKPDVDLERIGRRLRSAVAAGQMTAEEARAKWAEFQKKAEK